MTTFLLVQGMEPVSLAEDELYNKVRHRLNRTKQFVIDYQNGALPNGDDKIKFEPYHNLSFKTAEGGRISINYEKIIGVGSDEPKDVGSEE